MNNSSIQFPRLNLPPIVTDMVITDAGVMSIRDPLRRRYVALTPEEWVRQHFTGWLTGHKGYPERFVVNELGLKVNGRRRRADTVVFDRHLRPLMVIEYKRASVPVTQKVFDQIVRYNMTFNAPYVAVSNGMVHYCCHIDFVRRSYAFMSDFPDYPSISPE